MTASTETPIAVTLANFAASLDYDDVPQATCERAKHLILDAVGIALASTPSCRCATRSC